MPWELPDERTNHLTPPPQKRIKSADLYRQQHGLSPERERELAAKDVQPLLAAVGHRRSIDRSRDRERTRTSSSDHNRSRDSSSTHDRDRSVELRDSLLGQALEGGPTLTVQSVLFHSKTNLKFTKKNLHSNSKDVHGVPFFITYTYAYKFDRFPNSIFPSISIVFVLLFCFYLFIFFFRLFLVFILHRSIKNQKDSVSIHTESQ